MPKNIIFESFKYQFLIAAQSAVFPPKGESQPHWDDFVRNIEFRYKKDEIDITWRYPKPGGITAALDDVEFYLRGDNQKNVLCQRESSLLDAEDQIKLKNASYFDKLVKRVSELAHLKGYFDMDKVIRLEDCRIQTECQFHDEWAKRENVEKIDVLASNEACTAPEMRYITQRLGDIKGKRVLDLGSGLGEASVYFAMLGADVTSSDLSPGMVDAALRLAKANGVSVKKHIAAAEDMQLPQAEKFDIVYAGNLLHHVDIEKTITSIKPHLAEGGMFISWDPIAYNPAINVYRKMATSVRTSDEHPLTRRDIKLFRKHFKNVETRYFWLTSLLIFVIMALVQRRNPNKERFWKAVVQEGEKWRWLYIPLETLDKVILTIVPPLRLLCWNVVVCANSPK